MATSPSPALPLVPVETARRLLLCGQGLLADSARRATPAAVYRQIQAMGFVQMDTINVICRAHHHILVSRFDDYRPAMLGKLLERDRKLFEHWTHDASVIPTIWLRFWRLRFDRYRKRGHSPNSWWAQRMGSRGDRIVADVLDRVTRDGPLMSKDFEHPRPESSAWWGWKPQKAALEFLRRIGELGVARRINFHKVYDLMERIFPQMRTMDVPGEEEHLDWACRAALQRLILATPGELAGFLAAITPAEATAWCRRAARSGEVVQVLVEAANGDKPRRAFALPDWPRRAQRCPNAPQRMRLLSPFDPVIRDRKRALRLFNFDYRFEAFVPAAKRRYGYYVLPILQAERIVGRLDAKFHRDRGALQVKDLWWEAHIRPTRKTRQALDEALGRFAQAIGAERFEISHR